MQTWQDLGGGRHKLTVTSDQPGVSPSVYKGTMQEIASMLADSQSNANRRIAELRGVSSNGHGPQPVAAPVKPLTPEDRLKTVADLDNPATVESAITRVVESQIGPLSEIRNRQDRQDAESMEHRAAAAASQFAMSEPEWYGSEFNNTGLVHYMEVHGMNLADPNEYARAFAHLSAAGLLQLKPRGEGENQPESEEGDLEHNAPAPKAVVPRPSRTSTGISSRDISGVPPRPSNRLKYSREQLAAMGAAEYKNLMQTDGVELLRCEKWYSEHPPARRA